MKYSEIGSYFWLDGSEQAGGQEHIGWLPSAEDSCFTFSGRNAIETALQDILSHRRIDTVHVPSYCCASMLQAFAVRKLNIEFYQVAYENGRFVYQIPRCGSRSVVLMMSYFGLDAGEAHTALEELSGTGAVIVEDITHSLLRKDSVSGASDYAVASLRKWFPVPAGGWVGKKAGKLSEKPSMDSGGAVREKIAAMREKYEYLTGNVTAKENFLLAQANFEKSLDSAGRMLKIDGVSLRILQGVRVDEVIRRRRRNAEILVEGLKGLETVMSIPQVDLSRDVPLFLPVMMETEKRESLRKYLIAHRIYCPVHWPRVTDVPGGIQENELSLICDQRYGEDDMRAVVDAVYQWRETENSLRQKG